MCRSESKVIQDNLYVPFFQSHAHITNRLILWFQSYGRSNDR
jgi:hypothetical protein